MVYPFEQTKKGYICHFCWLCYRAATNYTSGRKSLRTILLCHRYFFSGRPFVFQVFKYWSTVFKFEFKYYFLK
ncbi:Hypothetical protein SRAE_2000292100 [Strongyloides ratti]|uniref:Uncharacterized protein n=1 Tax=Strongyloides ratti TaxID=34506 RepID=A0A090LJH3_STRRB|nr:Hypothetical protein SRAE_2000292100 [Strongyloides ratti]CEF68263.1 Hypothetical protein SRAE_2000292100 [Strongyloides ratti]